MSDLPFDMPDELDEIRDQAEEVGFLTPREFAKLMDVAPQQIYYWIRNGVLETEQCRCGRRILNVDIATKNIQAKKEARRSQLGTGHTSSTE